MVRLNEREIIQIIAGHLAGNGVTAESVAIEFLVDKTGDNRIEIVAFETKEEMNRHLTWAQTQKGARITTDDGGNDD